MPFQDCSDCCIEGARNAYGDGDNEGIAIHICLGYGIGILFTVAPVCMACALSEHHGWAQRPLVGLAVGWAILCPVFLLSPTSVDGLLERIFGLIAARSSARFTPFSSCEDVTITGLRPGLGAVT